MRVITGKARGSKLFSLEGENTRPTLDRVKESLFNIIQDRIYESTVLDLFAGSGALGIECLSRGANKVVFSDNSKGAVDIIQKNLEKTKLGENAIVINKDYTEVLKKISSMKFDIIFLDPPYKTEGVTNALNFILKNDMLSDIGIIVVETDREELIEKVEKFDINIIDARKYGRVNLIFLERKG